MQNELIHALSVIRPYTHDEKCFTRLINVIKTLDIPPTDYEKVAQFILLVLDEHPEIFDAKPHDGPLRDLCLQCINHIHLIEELKSRGPNPGNS